MAQNGHSYDKSGSQKSLLADASGVGTLGRQMPRALSRNATVKMAGNDVNIAIDEDAQEMRELSTSKRPIAAVTVKFVKVCYTVTVMPPQQGWNPLSFMVPKKSIQKKILHDITGTIMPGEVLALMGPSGGGKTTFLNVIGGRGKGKVEGEILYNDLPFSKNLKRRMGFVTQDDTFFPHLTVFETLMYAALLRLPKDLTREQKIQRASDTISDLGLDKCKNTIIGGQFMRGISGGERKRVSIGHEILIDPSLLLLDEPTSGLDSTTALKIVQVLRDIAKSGRTVITTIHQPSSRLFHSFDKLLLLSEGHSIYFGKASDAMSYYESVGFKPMFATNPADFMLDLANGTLADVTIPKELTGDDEFNQKKPPEQQAAMREYLWRSLENQLTPGINQEISALPPATDFEKSSITQKRDWGATWMEQFSILWIRGLKERRHELLSSLRFIQVIAIALICGALWFNSQRNTSEQLSDQVGLSFFFSIFWGFLPLITAIFTFPQERAMLIKERSADMYRLSAYFFSRTLSDIPMEWFLPIIFLVITYWMANLKADAGVFFATLAAIFLNITAAQGLGFAIGAAMMDVKKATTLASVILLTFMLAGGYYLHYIPDWIRWVKYIAFTFYAYRLMLKIQYNSSDTYQCGPSNDPASRICPISQNASFTGVKLDDVYVDILALLAMVVIYRMIAYYFLSKLKTKV